MAVFQTENLQLLKSTSEGAVLQFDVAGRGVNVFNRQVLADLDAALERVAADPAIELLGIRSADPSKPFAGADLQQFAAIASTEEATALSALGQTIFNKLANLRVPTVIAVAGPCLGGGLEFALACDYRLVIDHPKTQFGLPEVELGLLPGWGGTQRLPRAIGLERALRVILGGQRINVQQALRWGLADAVATSEEGFGKALRELADRALKSGKRLKQRLPLRTWRQRLLESTSLGRALLFGGTERLLSRKVPDDMPAPREALQAVRVGLAEGMEAGLAYERAAAGRLAVTPACRNLVNLFFQREKARKLPEVLGEAAAPIHRVGVVGAGTMGAGVAQLAALKGAEVVIQEIDETALGSGMLKIAALFQKASERGLLTPEESQRRLAAVRGTTKWEGFGDLDVVVEAAVEDLEAKQAIFRELDARTSPTAVLATNTSSLQVERLQQGTHHPERIAALHFFNPVHKMPLVEVVRAPATSEATAAMLTRWSVALGKTPVVVKDGPGFLVNRILTPYLAEAVLLVVEGMPVERVDQVMRRFGMPMGPLELLDQIGLDVAAHVTRSLEPAFGARLPPSTAFQQMQTNGWLGQKSGRGFYRYDGKAKKAHLEAVATLRSGRDASAASLVEALPPDVQMREARERMVLLMVNEAAACLAEGVASSAEAIGLAMVLGTGWAPHRGGPLRYADDRGLAEVVRVLSDLARRLGQRFAPHAELRRRAEGQEPMHVPAHPLPQPG